MWHITQGTQRRVIETKKISVIVETIVAKTASREFNNPHSLQDTRDKPRLRISNWNNISCSVFRGDTDRSLISTGRDVSPAHWYQTGDGNYFSMGSQKSNNYVWPRRGQSHNIPTHETYSCCRTKINGNIERLHKHKMSANKFNNLLTIFTAMSGCR